MAKKSKKASSKKRNRLLFLLILITLILVFSLAKRGYIQHIKLRLEKRRLSREIEAMKEQKAGLEKEKQLLDKPEHIEKIAREEYGMAKKDEKVYIVVPEKSKKSN